MNPYSNVGGSELFLIIIVLFWWIIPAIGLWKVFEKAGKPGWAAIIPIYSTIVKCEVAGKPIWWFLIIWLVPCVNYVFSIWLTNLVAKSFGKDEGYTVGLIILPFIFYPILGFGDAQYQGPAAAEAQAANRFGSSDYERPWDNNTPA